MVTVTLHARTTKDGVMAKNFSGPEADRYLTAYLNNQIIHIGNFNTLPTRFRYLKNPSCDHFALWTQEKFGGAEIDNLLSPGWVFLT